MLDLDRLRTLADPATEDGRRALAALLEAFVADTTEALGQLQAAAARGDTAAVRALAHAQKGASGMVGAVELADGYAAVERLGQDPQAAAVAIDRLREHLAVFTRDVDRRLNGGVR